MILTIKPTARLKGAVRLPSSKSYTIRAFLIASCGGVSKILNPSDCDDALVALRVARQLGAKVSRFRNNAWKITGLAFQAKTSRINHINVKESGTVLRFILPLLALRAQQIKVIGEGTLKSRPNTFLVKTLRQMGAKIYGRGAQECVPIIVQGGRLRAGRIAIDGSLSSQFISALLIALPNLKENTYLTIQGKKIVSATYITMTQQILKKAGIHIVQRKDRIFFIAGRQRFRGLKNFAVPSDGGLAAFLLVAASLVKSAVILKGFLSDDYIQSDGEIFKFLRAMGARIQKTRNFLKVRGPFRLKGGNFSLKNCPDLVPIISVAALFAKGRTRLYDIGHARAKESDRISDLRKELLKIGARIKERHGELTIYPQKHYKQNVLLDPHHDHRLAMSFAVLGLKTGTKVKNIECVSKSYPKFVADFKKIGALCTKS